MKQTKSKYTFTNLQQIILANIAQTKSKHVGLIRLIMAPPNSPFVRNEQTKQHQLAGLSNLKVYNLVEKDDSNDWHHIQHPFKEKPIGEASSRP